MSVHGEADGLVVDAEAAGIERAAVVIGAGAFWGSPVHAADRSLTGNGV